MRTEDQPPYSLPVISYEKKGENEPKIVTFKGSRNFVSFHHTINNLVLLMAYRFTL